MKKIRLRILVLVLLLSLVLATVAFAQDDLKRLEIRNRSDQLVTLVLASSTGAQTNYVLNVPRGATRIFTVEPDTYNHTTFACGEDSSGTLVFESNIRLTFTKCYSDAPNQGEPTQEKVHIPETPDGIMWFFQHR